MSLTNINGVICEDYNSSKPIGVSSNMVSTSGNQTVAGTKTFSSAPTLTAASNQLIIQPSGSGTTVSLTAANPASSVVYTLPDVGGAASTVMTAGTQTIGGSKTFSSGVNVSATTNQLVLGGLAHLLTINSPAIAAVSQTYTIPDSGVSCNMQLGVYPVVNIAAATTSQSLSIAQSGSIVYVPQCSANVTLTLPSPVAGWNCKFILTAVPNGANTFTITPGSAILSGVRNQVAAAVTGVAASNQTNLILGSTAANAAVGDSVDIFSDGVKFYYKAWSTGTASGWTTS